MAKKPLTPEQAEIKAMKKAKKSENWTKFWAILLAAVLTFAVVAMGKTAAEDAIEKAKEQNPTENVDSNNTTNNGGTNTDPFANSGSNSGTTDNNGGTTDNNGATNNGATNNGGTTDNGPSTADIVKAVNDATAKAAKASYKWTRKCDYTKAIDVGAATGALNAVIQGVDENASLDSVVGGFLGVGSKEADVVKGKAAEGMDEKYLLKAMTIQEADVRNAKVDGNVYMIQLVDCADPQKDGKNAMHHATNDFITYTEVNTSITNEVGSAVQVKPSSKVNYNNMIIKATIENGNLTKLEYSYGFSASLDISVAIFNVTGTGAAETNATYTNFKY